MIGTHEAPITFARIWSMQPEHAGLLEVSTEEWIELVTNSAGLRRYPTDDVDGGLRPGDDL